MADAVMEESIWADRWFLYTQKGAEVYLHVTWHAHHPDDLLGGVLPRREVAGVGVERRAEGRLGSFVETADGDLPALVW